MDFDTSCRRCERLATFLDEVRNQFPGYYSRPVPSFGDPGARLLRDRVQQRGRGPAQGLVKDVQIRGLYDVQRLRSAGGITPEQCAGRPRVPGGHKGGSKPAVARTT